MKNKGITLVSLVVTIIVLLILVGVSIAMLFGENSILSNAQKATEETQIRGYEEKINLAVTEANIVTEETEDEEILENIKDILQKDKEFNGATITGPEESEGKLRLVITTKEGYVYHVYGDKEEYIGKDGTIDEPEIEIIEGEITFEYSTTEWTNEDVEVKASTTSGYKIQISENGTTWTTTDTYTFKENGNIYARLYDGENIQEEENYAIAEVNIIDKEEPTIGNISSAFTIVSGNTGTITISSIADTGSGPTGIYISTSSTTPAASASGWISSTSSSYNKSVTSAGTYYVWVKDAAGNISEAKSCTVTTVAAVAKVGSTYYSSIANAINAISSSGTVTMLVNTTESPTIPAEKTITLDLNQKTITGALTNNGICTIDGNGTIIYANDDAHTISNLGTLNLKSGLIQHTRDACWSVHNVGTINISGGTISKTGLETAMLSVGTVNMTGGTISSNACGLCVHAGTANISGGSIICNSSYWGVYVRNTGMATIKNTTVIQNGSGTAITNELEYGKCVLYDVSITGIVTGQVYRIRTGGSTAYGVDVWGIPSEAVSVIFPTWTEANGQDDIAWYNGRQSTENGGYWYENIYASSHNNETGTYKTHIYWLPAADDNRWVYGIKHTL